MATRSANADKAPSIGQSENRQDIAGRMEALAIELRTMCDRERDWVPTEPMLVALAAKIYSARRKVDKIFLMQGFAVSPAWDMMMDLYQAKIQGKKISVTSACIGGACPGTTGLRWLQALENMQLINRGPDAKDKRRMVIELTDVGRLKVEQALLSHL